MRNRRLLTTLIALLISTVIGVVFLWMPRNQVAHEPSEPVSIEVVKEVVQERLIWKETKGTILSKRSFVIDDKNSYEVTLQLDVPEVVQTIPINAIEYAIFRRGDMIDLLCIYDSETETLDYVQGIRDEEGRLTSDIDQPIAVIDPGHGGAEKGEGSNDDWVEKAFNLKISKAMAEYLENRGIRTIMTRETDETINLYDRCGIATYSEADIFVSNHLNRMDGKASGIEVLYSSRADRDFAVSLAESMASEDHQVYRVYNRKATDQLGTDFYFVHKYNSCPSYIIEYGFSDNATDSAYILANWEEMVRQASEKIAVELLE